MRSRNMPATVDRFANARELLTLGDSECRSFFYQRAVENLAIITKTHDKKTGCEAGLLYLINHSTTQSRISSGVVTHVTDLVLFVPDHVFLFKEILHLAPQGVRDLLQRPHPAVLDAVISRLLDRRRTHPSYSASGDQSAFHNRFPA